MRFMSALKEGMCQMKVICSARLSFSEGVWLTWHLLLSKNTQFYEHGF